jgi:hypothetical protein
MRYKTFSVSIEWKNPSLNHSLWFQNGKLTDNPDWDKRTSSHIEFQTQKKFISFLRWLNYNYPDTIAKVWEKRKGQSDYILFIPMGEDLENLTHKLNNP